MKTKSETFICIILAISLMLISVKCVELTMFFQATLDMEKRHIEQSQNIRQLVQRSNKQHKRAYMALQAEIEALKAPCDRMEFEIEPEDMR